jgi:uncharacterized lipoprotein YajG
MNLVLRVILLSCFLVAGCTPQKGYIEFSSVVHDNKIVTTETCERLVVMIDEEINSGQLNDQQIATLESLKNRLGYMSKASKLMAEYVFQVVIDDDLLAQLLRHRWNTR